MSKGKKGGRLLGEMRDFFGLVCSLIRWDFGVSNWTEDGKGKRKIESAPKTTRGSRGSKGFGVVPGSTTTMLKKTKRQSFRSSPGVIDGKPEFSQKTGKLPEETKRGWTDRSRTRHIGRVAAACAGHQESRQISGGRGNQITKMVRGRRKSGPPEVEALLVSCERVQARNRSGNIGRRGAEGNFFREGLEASKILLEQWVTNFRQTRWVTELHRRRLLRIQRRKGR